jgi:DNA-binding Lrp family transcriptional regulator
MYELMEKYDGWKRPYVMSGVGQNWADIILEMRIESVQEMNTIADSIREIDGVQTTRTLIKGSQSFEGPLIFDNLNQIETVKRDELP